MLILATDNGQNLFNAEELQALTMTPEEILHQTIQSFMAKLYADHNEQFTNADLAQFIALFVGSSDYPISLGGISDLLARELISDDADLCDDYDPRSVATILCDTYGFEFVDDKSSWNIRRA